MVFVSIVRVSDLAMNSIELLFGGSGLFMVIGIDAVENRKLV